jgi:hypothetical protein
MMDKWDYIPIGIGLLLAAGLFAASHYGLIDVSKRSEK